MVLPQRDAVARLARREFPVISESMAYRFRDVHDHLVRLVDEALFFQDRVTSLLDAHLSQVSNQLNGVMKVLTIISTIFMPLGVIAGLWGMNVDCRSCRAASRRSSGGSSALMVVLWAGMLGYFRNSAGSEVLKSWPAFTRRS